MSRNYKFKNPEGLYFVSFATVFWVDVFVRLHYFDCLVRNLNYCVDNKGMEIYAWCIMPSHVHLWSAVVIDPKNDHTHNNPVVAGFVANDYDYLHSSARHYAGIKGLVKVMFT